MTFRNILLTLLLCALPSWNAAAQLLSFESGEQQVSLLELFTSEGCSSCPPADKWFNRLKNSPALWKEWVPVGWHVDYWDNLGWKDAASSPEATLREQIFGEMLHMKSIYTPCFLLNGSEWQGWYDQSTDFKPTGRRVGKLKAELRGERGVQVEFDPANNVAGPWRVEAAILGMGLVTSVTAGENRGTTLEHEFAMLSHTAGTFAHDGKTLVARLTLPAPSIKAPGYALAVWVTHESDPTPVQATGGFISQ